SMTANFGGTSRWQAVYDALLNPKDGLVMDLEDQVRFALGLYTSFNGNEGGECPVITEVPADLGNYAAIEAVYSANKPEDETPTGESILAVMDSLLNDPGMGDKVIVLATDGEPDTCAVPNPQTGQAVAVAGAVTAFEAGIKTFVISVGSQISDQHLQDMANAGVGVQKGDPDAPFYKANNKEALVAAFEEIINGVRDCTLILDGEVQEGFEDQCIVTVNGDGVPYLDPDGWKLNEPNELELVGKACEAIQEGQVSISIKCACGAIIPG
ncbi:MAG TPA: VWA domain-containing protein, partial [Nannocystis exedens]|nr:VWA domain-containing protein [Nannocystis exedens]